MTAEYEQQLTELRARLGAFVAGSDRSVQFVRQLEGLLTGEIYDDVEFQDLIEGVAMYNPHSAGLLHEQDLVPICRSALAVIERRLSPPSQDATSNT